MKQTAVEWLFDQIPLEWTIKRSAFDALQQAKAMEEEQKKDAFSAGQEQAIAESWLYDDAHPRFEEKAFMTFEQYYNETYGK